MSRGQTMGEVDFPKSPHVHFDLKQQRSDGLYFIDTYRPSISNCTEDKFIKQGQTALVDGKCSPAFLDKAKWPAISLTYNDKPQEATSSGKTIIRGKEQYAHNDIDYSFHHSDGFGSGIG